VAASAYAVLIRGINVGGKNKLPMAELRAALAEAAYEDVATYIQSGNVVVRSEASPGAVGRGIGRVIEDEFGLPVQVLVRTHAELVALAGANPFLPVTDDLAKLHVVFLDAEPKAASVAGLDPDRSPGDEFNVSGREIFLRYPSGSGRSKLTLDYFERRLGVAGTARNWNTLLKLIELTAPGSSG
jgi:uncharacterized protein (DUF1697 family)